jgi:hypothetical protein
MVNNINGIAIMTNSSLKGLDSAAFGGYTTYTLLSECYKRQDTESDPQELSIE